LPRHKRRISTNAQHRDTRTAQREHRRAVGGAGFSPFGIRRELEGGSEALVMDAFAEIADAGILPNCVRQRNSLHVTHMPITYIKNHLSRGSVFRYEFGLRALNVQNELQDAHNIKLPVLLGDAGIFKGGKLGYRIIDEALKEENQYFMELMGKMGLKGTMREKPPMHITLAETRGASRSQQHAMVTLLDQLLYREFDEGSEADKLLSQFDVHDVDDLPMVPEQVVLEPITFYDNKPS